MKRFVDSKRLQEQKDLASVLDITFVSLINREVFSVGDSICKKMGCPQEGEEHPNA